MNPNDPIVQTIARTLDTEDGVTLLPDMMPTGESVRIAMAVLFEIAKSGVKLVPPDDVIAEVHDQTEHTVSLLLRAE